ncbi:MAG TPA: DUF4838 domain-containing protein, partial [Clostridiales bacterium]|nr:DUF4838 domain-containing protein [Clostridiales bacterium]
VIVRLCSIECCFAHPISDPSCANNAAFNSDILGWQKICNRIYIWDYTTEYGNFLDMFPNFGVLQPNMRFFAANHVKGVYEEGNYFAAQSNGEFAELRAYMLAKLLWNPDIDYDKTMNDFMRAYYGKGWQYIREFIDMTIKNAGRDGGHMTISESPDKKGWLDLDKSEIQYCDDLWKNAVALADTQTQLKNVRMSELCWRQWKGNNKVLEFSRLQEPSAWIAANKALYDDYVKYGVAYRSEGHLLTTEAIGWYLYMPTKWR